MTFKAHVFWDEKQPTLAIRKGRAIIGALSVRRPGRLPDQPAG